MLLRSELLALGVGPRELIGQVQRGELVRIRRGAFRTPEDLAAEARHRELIRAVLAQTPTPAVVSHVSAAVVHGLPVDRRRLDRVHLLRKGRSRGDTRGLVVRHSRSDVEPAYVEGVAVTDLASTVVDLARALPFRDGVAVADAGLRRGLEREDLLARVERHPGRTGNPRARRVLGFADALSESPGESHTRVRVAESGHPVPKLQVELRDDRGLMRPDFTWELQRVLGEFDGKIKYGRLLKPGQTAEEVLVAERARERRLLRLGWEVVRFTWDDLRSPATVGRILAEGFADAARRFHL